MGFINIADKTINAKLVYYGVGLGGKTTSLQGIHKILCPRDEVKLVSINTEQDSTLLFDFLPINLGLVDGFKIRIQGFTVPGQPKYRVMRKYVLSGADAVVLVVDSQRKRLEENQKTIEDLRVNLKLNGLDADQIPLVFQYNKRDLANVMSEEELDRVLRYRDVKSFPSVATKNEGVFEPFCHAVRLLVERKIQQYGLGKGGVSAAEVADSAVKRLWEVNEESSRFLKDSGRLTSADMISLQIAEPVAPAEAVPADALATEAALAPVDVVAADLPAPAAVPDISDTGMLGQAVTSNMELARLYTELAEYKNLLERKNRELVEINQVISHDLKKPLTVIKTVVSLFDKGLLGPLHERQSEAIRNALEGVAYMEDLISDIIESSRLDYDGQQMGFEEVEVSALVGEILHRLRYLLTEQGVSVEVGPLPSIHADPAALTKVFMNLIGNSMNYREPSRPCVIKIGFRQEENATVFSVQDNGIGIPDPDAGAVFGKFKRGSNTAGITGTGLGLFIVRELVLAHGGKIWFHSEAGKGTTFYVRLPRAPVQPEHSRTSTVERMQI